MHPPFTFAPRQSGLKFAPAFSPSSISEGHTRSLGNAQTGQKVDCLSGTLSGSDSRCFRKHLAVFVLFVDCPAVPSAALPATSTTDVRPQLYALQRFAKARALLTGSLRGVPSASPPPASRILAGHIFLVGQRKITHG